MSMLKDYFFISAILLTFFLCFLRDRYLNNEITKQKELFIKILSHDIRVSVIAQIRGLNLINQSNCFSGKERDLLCEINNGCKYTLDIITMLLNIYKIEKGDLFLKYEHVNIEKMFLDICKDYNKTALEKNINIRFLIDDNYIFTDKEKLLKSLSILVETVIQYSKKNTDIIISSNKMFNKTYLNLVYCGASISEEEYKRMFEKGSVFSTVGHGIKMYLCKKNIDLLNGKIKFIKDCGGVNSFKIHIPDATKYAVNKAF